jgi:hypothetical protein
MPRDEDDDDFFDVVSATADRLKLKGRDRSKYIDDHMTGAGYRRIQSKESYQRPERDDDDDDDGGGRFRVPRRRRGSSGRRDDDDDSF